MTYPGYPTGQQMFQQGGPGQPQYPYGYQPVYTQQQQVPQPAYPGFAPQQPMQPQPQMPNLQGDLNARLPANDPSIPQELRGKTVGEALRFYGIMREDFVNRQQQRQQPAQQQPQGQQQYQQQPQSQAGWGRQPGQQHQQFQQPDPVRDTVREVMNEVLPQALAPIVQPMQQQQLLSTYNAVKARFGDWQQVEGDVLQSMQGAEPATLMNPAAWEAAYYHAKGKVMTQRQLPAGPQQQQQNQGYGPPMPQQYQQQPQAQVPVYQVPQQGYQGPLGNQFVEGPTPPANGMYAQQQDPRDEMFARRFNMPLEVYRSWKSGRVGLMPQQQPQQMPQMNGQNMQQPQQPNFNQQPQAPYGYPQAGMTQFGQPSVPGFYQPQQMNGGGYAP